MHRSIVIANYVTVTTDSETFIYKGKGHKLLFVKLSQEVHNKMPTLPSEETILTTANDCQDLVNKCDSSTGKTAWEPELPG